MSEIPIIGEVKSIEQRADGSDWIEVELSPGGIALLKTDQRTVRIVNFERRQRAAFDIMAANQESYRHSHKQSANFKPLPIK